MKTNKFPFILLAIILLLASHSCRDNFNDDDTEPELKYLVRYELERSLLPVMIRTIYDLYADEYPQLQAVSDKVDHGIRIYRITYRTTFNGEPVIASGMVSAPLGEGIFPLLSYQNGTNTLHSDAPSVNIDRDLYLMLQSVASTGFIVAMPDYLGFGETDDMFHPYLHKNSTIPVVIDMLQAVEELGKLQGFETNDDLYLTGYSLGGWATLQVQKEIEHNFSNEFNLIASAPGAGPYNLNLVSEYILSQPTYPMPYFLGYVFDSFTKLNEFDTPLEAVFNAPYNSQIPGLYNGSLSGEEINKQLSTSIPELFQDNFLVNRTTDPLFTPIFQALDNNSVEAWPVSTPTRLIHSADDELVPLEISDAMYQDFINSGTDNNMLELITIAGYSHTEGIIPAGLISLLWFLELKEN